jgi:hypothetical protein
MQPQTNERENRPARGCFALLRNSSGFQSLTPPFAATPPHTITTSAVCRLSTCFRWRPRLHSWPPWWFHGSFIPDRGEVGGPNMSSADGTRCRIARCEFLSFAASSSTTKIPNVDSPPSTPHDFVPAADRLRRLQATSLPTLRCQLFFSSMMD